MSKKVGKGVASAIEKGEEMTEKTKENLGEYMSLRLTKRTRLKCGTITIRLRVREGS